MSYNNRGFNNNRNKQTTNHHNQINSNNLHKEKVKNQDFFNKIKEGYAHEAESKMRNLFGKGHRYIVSTSQIRGILSLINEISSMVLRGGDVLSGDIKNQIQYLLVKLYYQSGKERNVKNFVDETELIELLLCVEDNRKDWEIFSKYVEALVAFHKYLGGKD